MEYPGQYAHGFAFETRALSECSRGREARSSFAVAATILSEDAGFSRRRMKKKKKSFGLIDRAATYSSTGDLCKRRFSAAKSREGTAAGLSTSELADELLDDPAQCMYIYIHDSWRDTSFVFSSWNGSEILLSLSLSRSAFPTNGLKFYNLIAIRIIRMKSSTVAEFGNSNFLANKPSGSDDRLSSSAGNFIKIHKTCSEITAVAIGRALALRIKFDNHTPALSGRSSSNFSP